MSCNFAQALSDELRALGMTQAALAEAVGVKQNTVSRWVSDGGFSPDVARVFAIERALGLVPGTLSIHLGYMPAVAGPPAGRTLNLDGLPDDLADAVTDVFRRLSLIASETAVKRRDVG